MNRWKVILAAALIFLAGVASGACGLYLYKAERRPQTGQGASHVRPSPITGPRTEFLRRASSRLDLTPAQHEKVDALLSDSQQRMRKLWEPVAPQARLEMENLQKSIEELLTPEQKTKFAKLLSERAANQGSAGSNPRRREREEKSDTSPGTTNREANPGRDPSPGH